MTDNDSIDHGIYREIYSGPPLNVSYWVMDPATEYWQDILASVCRSAVSVPHHIYIHIYTPLPLLPPCKIHTVYT